jgi:hypothetical protein
MPDPLVVLSNTTTLVSEGIVVIDYDTFPYHLLCRYGLWEGWQTIYTGTITLAFEHDADHPEYLVGWQVSGTTIVEPGFSPGTLPGGAPLSVIPGVTYTCPVDGYYHEIAFTSSPGAPDETFWVQVLYRTSYGQPTPTPGPGMWVTLLGETIEWPWFLLAEQQACIERLLERINAIRANLALGEFAPVNPGDPLKWAARFTPEEARLVKAGVEMLEKMDTDEQPELAKRIATHLNGIVQVRTPNAKGFYGLDKGAEERD